MMVGLSFFFFRFVFCKQKTAYEMRISDWSSDVCSSDLAGLIGEFADDFDRNGGGVPDAIAVVGAVGIGARDEGMPLVRLLEQGHRAIAVLHIGRMDQYDKGATIGIDHCMAFASHGLLACVVTTRSACF